MTLRKIYETSAVKIYEIDGSSEYKVEAGQIFWFTDTEGNGSIPEMIHGTVIETEVLNFLQKFETAC